MGAENRPNLDMNFLIGTASYFKELGSLITSR